LSRRLALVSEFSAGNGLVAIAGLLND